MLLPRQTAAPVSGAGVSWRLSTLKKQRIDWTNLTLFLQRSGAFVEYCPISGHILDASCGGVFATFIIY